MDLDQFIESIMKCEKEVHYPHSMYHSEGVKYLHLKQYEKAVNFFDSALQKDPTNINSWLKRSETFLGLKEYEKAKEDAMRAIKLNPLSAKAIDLKGQAEYLMGDFEDGYLTYLKGQNLIPGNEKLRLGKQLCQEAMDNSLRPVRKMTVVTDDLRLLRRQSDEGFKQHISGLRGRQATYERFLSDKKFLEALLSDKCRKSIHSLCKEVIQYIENSQRFWSMQMPLHTRKKIPKFPRKSVIKPMAQPVEVFICRAAKRRCSWELEKGRVNSCITEVYKLLERIKSIPDKFFLEKIKLKGDALHLLSLAHQRKGNHTLFLRYLYQELELAKDDGLIFMKIRALHHLGSYYLKSRNLQKTYFCLENIISVLNFCEAEKFFELNDILEKEALEEFKAAKKWTDDFVSNLQDYIQDTIISPAANLVKRGTIEALRKSSDSEDVLSDSQLTNSDITDLKSETSSLQKSSVTECADNDIQHTNSENTDFKEETVTVQKSVLPESADYDIQSTSSHNIDFKEEISSVSEGVRSDCQRASSDSFDFKDETTSSSLAQESEDILPRISSKADDTMQVKISDDSNYDEDVPLTQSEIQHDISSHTNTEMVTKYPEVDESTSDEIKNLKQTSVSEEDTDEMDKSESQISEERTDISTEIEEAPENSE
ncbi:tetratricopeptide repeat protein 25-like [Stegodyphus dumicola]|uniref:tetratricopeptide repeat protein 25-like n=1 Tax=Stegodyphus dumicola TaxID=202533 RepID=UPI0015B1715C|nr:tetratricopeptide repeat protein 25-like [Stegodyphus dumicola]